MLGPGATIQGRFVVEHEVQRGGMGTVYRAVDRKSDDLVAIKVLGRPTQEYRERFSQEALALCALDHPAIVRYVAEGETDEGERYLVMEWLEGEDLSARIARGPLSIDECVRVATRVAGALGHVHERGLVHRDIKPSNLFVPEGQLDEIKLVDFGLVRFLGTVNRQTATGVLVGTPGYFAPEQARSSREIDARADVFALGCVLFECLTGRAAFEGDSLLAVLSRIVFAETPHVSTLRAGIPTRLDDLVARMLDKEPSHRPRDGNDLVRELDALSRAPAELVRPSLPEPSSGARRLLSVVLARAAEEPMDGDTVQVLMEDVDGPLEGVRRTVISHDARLEALADGSVVAVVAGTGAATDQAVRAGRMALAMRGSLKGWRMSLATGLGDAAEGPPVGDVVDRAARLLGRPGVIALDELTAGLLEARFDLHGTVGALELVAERPSPSSRRVLLGKPTPCVGRERERALLRGLFDQCAAEWMPRVALVTGPAGAGKSRLRHELVQEIGARAWILPGQGDDLRAGAPFGLLVPALETALELRDAAVEAPQDRLRARVGRYVPSADVERVSEFLGELVGVRFPDEGRATLRLARRDADLMDAQMLGSFEDLLRAESAARPVLVVLDDLQWGDGPSVRFVNAALGLRGHPIFVLAFARPEVNDVFPGLWGRHDVQAIELPPLSSRASERLVHAVLGAGAPAERVRRIVEQASGNAFFLEELIRAEVQGGDDGPPGTVLAMMHARLSALPADALETLCRASVLGRSFWESSTSVLFPGEPPGARATVIDQLVSLELVHRRASSRFPGENELVFRHDLVRQAAYEMLRHEERAAVHRAVAEWLEDRGDADAAVLARHLERGGLAKRAAIAYLEAARQSLFRGDLDVAVEHAEAGVRCGATGDVRARLRLVQGEALVWRGKVHLAQTALLEAKALVDEDSPLMPSVLAWLASASIRSGNLEQVLVGAQAFVKATAPPERQLPLIRSVHAVIVAVAQMGRTELAREIVARIESWASESPDPAVELELAHVRASRAAAVGDSAEYLRKIARVIDEQDATGDSRHAVRSRLNLGFALTELGQHERAIATLRRVVEDSSRDGMDHMCATAMQNLGLALTRRGELAEASAVLDQSIALFDGLGDKGWGASSRLYMAILEFRRGAPQTAELRAREALEGLRDFPTALAFAYAVLARILLALGRSADALELAQRAHDVLLDRLEVEEGQAWIYLAMVECLDAAHRRDEADRALRTALEWVMSRAERIDEPALRESFLAKVPETAEILRLAQRLS